eukprot:517582-Prorocentrum_lima.AAC.1
MTSSLVGSEMCIRDSQHTGGSQSSTSRGTQTFRDEPDRIQRKAYKAVSYTHLTLPTICSV